MRTTLLILTLLMSFQGFSQDPFFQESNPASREEAIKITDQYISQLALNGQQQVLFQQKIEEFLLRRNKIEKEFSGKQKLNMLYDMQQEETAEMNDILTRPQLEVYKKIKPSIQPLETVGKRKE